MNYETRTVRPPGLGVEFDVLREDTIIGPAIEQGAWEDHETGLFLSHIRPKCTVLDLGANVGWFSVQAIRAGANVHAFEPVPGIADVAERNIERANKVGPGHGVLHRYAAGDKAGTASIALAAKNRGDNRVTDGELPADMQDAETVEIQIAAVDDFVDTPVRVMKIDTQGSEWLALQGAKATLARSPKLALLLEFWPYALRGAKPEQLLELLAAEGFRMGKATAAPYPMAADRILKQALARDPVKGGLDLYGTRGLPFHVFGAKARLRSTWRSVRED
ncbi:MAG: FkbM family methyltransferase [Planctomycetota bacterium]|jgi:FkbM family methyltransferase